MSFFPDGNMIAWGGSTFFVFTLCTFLFVASAIVAGSRGSKHAKEAIKKLPRDEEGIAYALSVIMLLPLYVLLMCATMELCFLVTARLGVERASFAAARACAVRCAVDRPSDRSGSDPLTKDGRDAAQKALVEALMPFASGLDVYKTPSDANAANAYVKAYKSYLASQGATQTVKDSYLLARWASAEKRSSVAFKTAPIGGTGGRPCDMAVTATVTYDAPFHFPLVGRLLGGKSKNGAVVYTMQATATLPVDAPRNNTGFLGAPPPKNN